MQPYNLPTSAYLICTSMRSGSNVLADLLRQTGIAGVPREYLTHPERFGLNSDKDYETFLRHILKSGSTPNGIFGAKLFWFQVEELRTVLARVPAYSHLSFDEALGRVFPRLSYIGLQRRDKLRQAISLHVANETGFWSSKTPRDETPATPSFDFRKIDNLRLELIESEVCWNRFFQARNIAPHRIFYEDMIDNWSATVGAILRFLKITGTAHVALSPSYERQSDAMTEDWVKLFNEISNRKG